jgi:AMP-polyphosphate phosphotransferase
VRVEGYCAHADWMRGYGKLNDFEKQLGQARTGSLLYMIDCTSTEIVPWTLVEVNDKSYAHIKVLKALCKRIETALER